MGPPIGTGPPSQGAPHLPPWPLTEPPPCAELLLDESCAEAQDGELDGLWTTISIFITLFLLSVCYSATVTLFKVGCSCTPRAPRAPHHPHAVPTPSP
ncbi:Ig gamma-3 chain C region [Myotis davidii]|uniref:Ig gamma-3 chain C region n=1 Tax=Myotis davidii TaxID=225400 RepID=L5LET2_MYODS|nr:Ig gamma-3 chain C region [Myotis davidii]